MGLPLQEPSKQELSKQDSPMPTLKHCHLGSLSCNCEAETIYLHPAAAPVLSMNSKQKMQASPLLLPGRSCSLVENSTNFLRLQRQLQGHNSRNMPSVSAPIRACPCLLYNSRQAFSQTIHQAAAHEPRNKPARFQSTGEILLL